MTTKDYCLPFKDKQKIVVDDFSNDQYSNLNLNYNHQSSDGFFVHSKSVEIKSKKLLNDGFYDINDSQNRNISLNKFSKTLPNSNIGYKSPRNLKKFKSDSKNVKNSTLSLHIAAFKNSNEALNLDKTFENFIKDGKLCSAKKWKSANYIFNCSETIIQNTFEFPRQQENDKSLDPEVSQFKASQRLFNPNKPVVPKKPAYLKKTQHENLNSSQTPYVLSHYLPYQSANQRPQLEPSTNYSITHQFDSTQPRVQHPKMPPPPPPAPPPPPGLLNVPKATNERSKLLTDIQKGARLKKTVTNDRSAPLVAGAKPAASNDNNTGIKLSHPGNSSTSSSAPSAGGLGGLFANGMPKKPSDNKNKKYPAPEMKPGPPPVSVIKAATTSSVVPPPKPLNSLSIKQDGNTTHFPSNVNSAPQTTNSVPPPPPPMPQMKQKAPPPEAPPATAKPNQTQKFSTIRPPPPASKPQQLRRTGSSEEAAPSPQTSRPVARPAAPPPPPPSRPPVRSTPSIDEDNEPPPPPPPPRHTSVAAPSAANASWQSSNTSIASTGHSRPLQSSIQKTSSSSLSSAGNFNNSHKSLNSGGSGMIRPFEERFHFLSINELPPPEPFKNFPKTYDQPRTAAN
uniref:WH2 domain-containing protein n=1 Tax=Panagrolaimus sp. PS1159 TaxID=55785 RepID=A0AC35EXK2_9BILA